MHIAKKHTIGYYRHARARRPVLQKVLNGITQLVRKFIRSPVLLLGSMALLVLAKVLTDPDRKK